MQYISYDSYEDVQVTNEPQHFQTTQRCPDTALPGLASENATHATGGHIMYQWVFVESFSQNKWKQEMGSFGQCHIKRSLEAMHSFKRYFGQAFSAKTSYMWITWSYDEIGLHMIPISG